MNTDGHDEWKDRLEGVHVTSSCRQGKRPLNLHRVALGRPASRLKWRGSRVTPLASHFSLAQYQTKLSPQYSCETSANRIAVPDVTATNVLVIPFG